MHDLAETLAQALEHHRAGRIDQAEEIYRRILAGDPRHADSLHLLGMVEQQRGRYEIAALLIGQAITVKPEVAAYHSNLGTVFQALGNLQQAGICFNRALDLKPDWPEVLTNLGNIRLAEGKLDEAAAFQERALALKTDFAEAFSNLGNVRQAQGRLNEAAACYERALALKPNVVNVHNNFGTTLLSQDRVEEAIEHYERCVALDPNFSSGHNNLGIAFMRQGRIDEAQAHYERAIAIKPDANIYNNLGNVFKERGQFEQAAANYGRAIELRPDYAEAHLNRSELKRFTPGDPDLRAIENLAARADLPADKMLFVDFALAKALDDIGDYARAWEHLVRGNALKRQQIHYQESRVLEFFERIREIFDRNLMERFEGSGDPSAVPIFVVGMPRSGSTLIEQILASHPQIHGAGELTILEKMETEDPLRPFPESIATLDRDRFSKVGATYVSRLPALSPGEMRIVDKLPGNFLRIGLIRLILPCARIIHTTRNPVDTCLSCFSKLFSNGLSFTWDLTELGRYYRAYSELMAHWRSVLPPGAMIEVSYEDVVADLETQARRLIDYCGLAWNDQCIRFHQNSRTVRTASSVQVRQPLYRNSLGRGRHYEAGLGPLLKELGAIVGR